MGVISTVEIVIDVRVRAVSMIAVRIVAAVWTKTNSPSDATNATVQGESSGALGGQMASHVRTRIGKRSRRMKSTWVNTTQPREVNDGSRKGGK